jgi:peptide/nickel transport system permease protein
MLYYTIRRFFYMVVVLWIISVVSFIIIQLPPGDYLTSHIMQLQESGTEAGEAEIAALKRQYGLDLPGPLRYFKWVGGILRGDFGRSFEWNRPVKELLLDRVPLTIVISVVTIVFTYLVAIPIGIYSATHQYSLGDWAFTTLGFVGLATPNFFLALILMYVFYRYLGLSVSGLFSAEYMREPWGPAKVFDMLQHLPVPIIVVGTAGTAGLIRVLRGCLLDELRKQYVITARAKGVSERTLLFKYPVRIAINPLVSSVSWLFPQIVSGATITSVVLNLPTTGPLLLGALLSEDIYLASSVVLLLGSMTVFGTFISDILLVSVDPRIRLA